MISTLLFLLFFLLVLAWVSLGDRARFESAAQLPLDEARAAASRSTCQPEPSDD
ncbi:MAG: hypothetical protein H8E31_13565 [Planctomycetes bacterium]|nr:hypothetical protein [Planctomycetota bacterium]